MVIKFDECIKKWGETVCAALVAGSVVHGNVPRYCIKGRVCNVYL